MWISIQHNFPRIILLIMFLIYINIIFQIFSWLLLFWPMFTMLWEPCLLYLLHWKGHYTGSDSYTGNDIVTLEMILLHWKWYCYTGNYIIALEVILLHKKWYSYTEIILLHWKWYCYSGNDIVTLEVILLDRKWYCYTGSDIVKLEMIVLHWKWMLHWKWVL